MSTTEGSPNTATNETATKEPASEQLLSTISTLSRESAEKLVTEIRARRIAAVEKYKEQLRQAAALEAEKQRVKANRLLAKIDKNLKKALDGLEAAEAQLSCFDIGDYTCKSLRK